jgi:membrane-associated protease RseP (regulator of RpoE activity)
MERRACLNIRCGADVAVLVTAIMLGSWATGVCRFAWAANSGQNEPHAPAVCGWIGIQASPMTVPVADSLGMTEPYGAIFDRPETGSPAANAGIEAGDVITAINGTPLTNWRVFATTIAAISPGTVIYLSTIRNGEPMEIKLTLASGACPGARVGGSIGTPTHAAPNHERHGRLT